MAGNVDPVYSRVGNVSSDGSTAMAPTLTTAAADYTGISANNKLVFTADATNGSYIQKLRFKAVSTNAATVARIYFNNGSTNTTASNNSFFGEVSLPATTGVTTTATVEVDYPLNVALDPSFRIYVGLGATVVGGWVITPVGGKY